MDCARPGFPNDPPLPQWVKTGPGRPRQRRRVSEVNRTSTTRKQTLPLEGRLSGVEQTKFATGQSVANSHDRKRVRGLVSGEISRFKPNRFHT